MVTATTSAQVLTSPMVDFYIRLGIAVERYARSASARPDVEVRIQNGMMSLFVAGNDTGQRVGTRYLEPNGDDFDRLAEFVLTTPKESQ